MLTPQGILRSDLFKETLIKASQASLIAGLLKVSLIAGVCSLTNAAFADRAKDLRDLTGAPTRMVWIQDTTDAPCVVSERPTLRLMGFDTEDGKGERSILPDIARYFKPLVTDDGTRIMFGDLDKRTVSVVNFDGTGLKTVLEDATFEDVWTDPRTGTEWFYASVQEQRDDKKVPVIRRYRLDDPKVNELVWDKMKINTFMLSGDGRAASGGGDGGNSPQGMLTLPNGDFYARAGGCWPSMCPDNTQRSWVFTGSHRSIRFCIPTNKSGTAHSYIIPFDQSPGLTLKGRQEVYHPRWSNHPRFFGVTSPLEEWSFKAEAKIPKHVADKVELYVGKFSEDFKSVERWVQVTDNNAGDYWPCVWVKPPPGPPEWLASVPNLEPEQTPASSTPDKTAQVFLWDTGNDPNQLIDTKTGAIRQCIGQFRDFARYARYYAMDLAGGAFIPDATAEPLLAAVTAANAFALEGVLTPPVAPPNGEAIILAFAESSATGNVVLAQQGEWLTLRLSKSATISLVRLAPGKAQHVIISYASGNLRVYLDGRRAMIANAPQVDLKEWTAQPLIFGDSWKGGANWPGLLEGIGLFGREITATEARQRYQAQLQRRADRKDAPEPLIVEAKLIGPCAAADPKGIAPYKRCLSTQQYEVLRVIKGKCDSKKISVAQWSVLDGKVLDAYLAYKPGGIYTLAIEPWADRPEQESERMISGDFSEEGGLFYEVRQPINVPAATAASEPEPVNVWQTVAAEPKTRRLKASLIVRGMEAPQTFVADAGVTLDAAGQPITIENSTLSNVAISGNVRLAGSGAVAGAVVVRPGSDYSRAPLVKFSGGGGSGAVGEAMMSVTGLEVLRLGSGYTKAPIVHIGEPDVLGGRQAKAIAEINKASGSIARLRISNPGSGYLRAPVITLEGGDGSGAEIQPTLSVESIFVTHGGTGYTTPPTVTLQGDGAEAAAAQAHLQRTTLRCSAGSGGAFITNTGKLAMDGAAILFDWVATARSTEPRGLKNTGTWEMANGALIGFRSTGALPFWNVTISNEGTMRLSEGARIGLEKFLNEGTLELGANTMLGQHESAGGDNLLTNTGQIRVIGCTPEMAAAFGQDYPTGTGKRMVENGNAEGSAKARFTVGSGSDAATFRVTGGQVIFTNHPGAALAIAPGATLELRTNDNAARNLFSNRAAKLINAGDLLLAGHLMAQGNHGGFIGIENRGRVVVQGDRATIVRPQNSCGPGGFYKIDVTSTQLVNHEGGRIEGSGTLTHINKTEQKEMDALRVLNFGIMFPGGAQPGKLVFAKANVRFGSVPAEGAPADAKMRAGHLRILIAGAANCSALETSNAFILTEGAANTLDVVTKPGFKPQGTFRIVSAGAVKGTFANLQYNGADQVPYTVNYLADGIEVVFP